MSNRELVSPERCRRLLRVPANRESMFIPGDYPCTAEKDHDKGKEPTPHKCVIGWKEPPPEK